LVVPRTKPDCLVLAGSSSTEYIASVQLLLGLHF
jgi:hypothetical protein